MTRPEFLTRARHLYPASKRFLLVSWGDLTSLEAIRHATYLGQIDACLRKPAQARDEQFHIVIAERLEEWARASGGGFEVVKVVSEEPAARCHKLRELLTRNDIEFGFYAADSCIGQALLEQAGATSATLPVVIVFDGQVLENPTKSMVADALGMNTRPGTVVPRQKSAQ